MQLRAARLCLDCEEVHNCEHCPVCASEAFAYLSRWVPTPERRKHPRPAAAPQVEIYKKLTQEHEHSRWTRVLGQSALGLTVAGLMGWLVRSVATDRRPRGKAA